MINGVVWLLNTDHKGIMEDGGCLVAIRNLFPELSPAEKKIGSFILQNPELSLNLGIVDLAERCKVSPAMVTRFSTKLGFSGFQAMKANLMVDMLSPDNRFFEAIQVGDSHETIMEKVVDFAVLGLKDTMVTLDSSQLTAAADAILGARSLFFAPAGMSSQGVITVFKQKLLNLGVLYIDHPEHYLASSQVSLVTSADAVLCVSHHGRGEPLEGFLRQSQQIGATTICLTNYSDAPITKYSDIKLITAASRSSPIFGEAITVRASQIVVLDALYAIMAMKRFREEGKDAASATS